MSCLANADIFVLAQAWQAFELLPVVDGDLFVVTPAKALSNASLGLVKPVPTFMLSLPAPGALFVHRFLPAIEAIGFGPFLESVFGAEVGFLLSLLYPDYVYGQSNDTNTLFTRTATLIGDMIFLCPARRHASLYLAFTPEVYVAQWNVLASFMQYPPAYGIIHGTTVPFVFGNAVDLLTQTPGTFTPEEALLSKHIMKTVGKFMRTGNPGSDYPKWIPELHAEINLNNITQINGLDSIRHPVAGQLPPPIPTDTRCGMWDVFFAQSLAGQLAPDFALRVAEKFNIWEGTWI